MGEDNSKGGEVAFNMAIATLQRIDLVLRQITLIDTLHLMDTSAKQKAYIDLTQRLFVISSPLLFGLEKEKKKDEEKTNLEDLQDEILNLKIECKTVVISGNQKLEFVFSRKLEKRIHEILIDIQRRLKPYMMPSKSDPRYGWGQGE